MLLNRTKLLAIISGVALSGLVSACSANTTAQSTAAGQEQSAAEGAGSQAATEPMSQQTTPPLPDEDKDIGVEKAKELALEKAGVSAEEVAFINAHLDRDDGRVEYDVEFQVGTTEYEVSVDAVTGAINEFSSEEADD